MSKRRRLGIAVGVILAAIVGVSAIGVGWMYVTFRELGESLGQGFLGPPDERQRIEMPDHRFAISFAGNWVVETDPDPIATARSHVHLALVAAPESGVPRCHVDAVSDGASLDTESFLLALAADRRSPSRT